MKLKMNNLLKLVFFVGVTFGSHLSWAQNNQAPMNYDAITKEVSFSIENLSEVIKHLDEVDKVATRGINQQTMQLISERFSAAIILVTKIMTDPSVTPEKRFENGRMLLASIGQLFITVTRHHGEDKLDIGLKDLGRLKGEGLTEALRAIEKGERMSPLTKAGHITREFFLSPFSLIWFESTADKKRIWSPLERINRDRLLRTITADVQDFARTVLPEYQQMSPEHASLYDKVRGMFGVEVIRRTMAIRNNRLAAQKVTTALYFGLTIWGLALPAIDIFGLFEGRGPHTLMASGLVIYFPIWFMVASTKAASYSKRSLEYMRDTVKLFIEHSAKVREIKIDRSLKSAIKDFTIGVEGRPQRQYYLWGRNGAGATATNMCVRFLSSQ